jgi:hypothetical protein
MVMELHRVKWWRYRKLFSKSGTTFYTCEADGHRTILWYRAD